MENNNYEYNGVSFLSILFLVFLVLKLTNVIDWSWWWVTAPLWIPIIIFLVFCWWIVCILPDIEALQQK